MAPDRPIEYRYLISPETIAEIQTELATRRQRFQYRFFENSKCPGVYAIWWQHRCLYVGRSTDGTIYNRLCSHMADCHNNVLKSWIKVKGDQLKFSYLCLDGISELSMISTIETELIRLLNAELNVLHGNE